MFGDIGPPPSPPLMITINFVRNLFVKLNSQSTSVMPLFGWAGRAIRRIKYHAPICRNRHKSMKREPISDGPRSHGYRQSQYAGQYRRPGPQMAAVPFELSNSYQTGASN